MAKPNYSYEKRQREIAKKKKKEEKSQRKLSKGSAQADVSTESSSDVPTPVGTDDTVGNT